MIARAPTCPEKNYDTCFPSTFVASETIFHQLAPFQPTLIGTFLDRAWLNFTW